MNQLENKLLLVEEFCRENKHQYDRQAFFVLFNNLNEKKLLNLVDSDYLNKIKLFPIQNNNIIGLFYLLLLPYEFHQEDSLGFYFTINYYLKQYSDYSFPYDSETWLPLVAPQMYEAYTSLTKFDDMVPKELYAKYNLSAKNIIQNFIIYNTYFGGKDNIDELLLDVIVNQDYYLERLKVNGLNDYFHINHNFILLNNYYTLLEILFNDHYSDNKRIIK